MFDGPKQRIGSCFPIGFQRHCSGTSCGNQVHLVDHVPSLCYRVCFAAHASVLPVYGIALYLELAILYNVMGAPVSGPISSCTTLWRERSVVNPSSQMHVVTLSQPATHSFRHGYANTCQYVASTEAILVAERSGEILTVDLPQAYRPGRSTHRFTIQANAEVAAPESRGQR